MFCSRCGNEITTGDSPCSSLCSSCKQICNTPRTDAELLRQSDEILANVVPDEDTGRIPIVSAKFAGTLEMELREAADTLTTVCQAFAPLVGYTYPRWLQNRLCWWLWRHLCCRYGWHLLDEVVSNRHYLYCDACDTEIELPNSALCSKRDAIKE